MLFVQLSTHGIRYRVNVLLKAKNTVKLDYNELGHNKHCYNDLGFNEHGYNEHSVIKNKFFRLNRHFITQIITIPCCNKQICFHVHLLEIRTLVT